MEGLSHGGLAVGGSLQRASALPARHLVEPLLHVVELAAERLDVGV
jgi:hypothetical protein